MSCWTLLGLPATSDTRSIKRHYAKLLKQTRPDEDPEGFQRLRDAYEQALEQAHWMTEAEGEDIPQPAPCLDDLPVLQAPAPLSPAQRVAPLLEGIRIEQLDQRHRQALEADCLLEFELGLLRHCVEHPEQSSQLLAWALGTFHWLTAWQRLELPEYLTDTLLQQCRQALEQPLREALEHQDAEAFTHVYAAHAQQDWLHSLDQRQWFNQCLATMLLESPYWSSEVFRAVCAGQGWQEGKDNTCPLQAWQRLLERDEAPVFIARQRTLATQPPASPEQRAAYLLLAPISLGRRRAFARRLNEEDWASCRKLSSRLHADHPLLAAQMPGSTPFFWRDWEFAFNSWPMYLALFSACLAGALARYAPQSNSLGEIIGVTLFWSACFAASAALLHWLWQPLAHRLWARDHRLGSRLPSWLNPNQRLLPLRDLLPVAVLGPVLGYVCGPISALVYLAVLPSIALVRNIEFKHGMPWRQLAPWQRRLMGGLGCVLLAAGLLAIKLLGDYGTVTANQGLQQWSERLCARMPANAPDCAAPATRAQWYGREGTP
ncbi:J domain-containing protein [Pseudomonas sp. MPFS]|uniref:J domain-containing protein n=1 Tax=Pseudomonas sp. MPFS TaxID=2795724 RepID=UPI001F1375EA|nr:J domain-containing protein [Pseudomonas sp. MPFS]UMZ09291.1 J domain-containing protein [Pseudomonas sp. MPFS]